MQKEWENSTRCLSVSKFFFFFFFSSQYKKQQRVAKVQTSPCFFKSSRLEQPEKFLFLSSRLLLSLCREFCFLWSFLALSLILSFLCLFSFSFNSFFSFATAVGLPCSAFWHHNKLKISFLVSHTQFVQK